MTNTLTLKEMYELLNDWKIKFSDSFWKSEEKKNNSFIFSLFNVVKTDEELTRAIELLGQGRIASIRFSLGAILQLMKIDKNYMKNFIMFYQFCPQTTSQEGIYLSHLLPQKDVEKETLPSSIEYTLRIIDNKPKLCDNKTEVTE